MQFINKIKVCSKKSGEKNSDCEKIEDSDS